MNSMWNSLKRMMVAVVVMCGIGFSLAPQVAPASSKDGHVQIAREKDPAQDGQETHG